MTTEELAYIAALVDTLAKFSVRVVHRDKLPVITIQGKHAVLPWLAEITGVKLMRLDRAYTKHNCTEHCPSRHQDIESWTYRWQLTGGRAAVLLTAVQPYLKVQATEARRLIRISEDTVFKPVVVSDMQRRVMTPTQ
jgi:hypothetical protein